MSRAGPVSKAGREVLIKTMAQAISTYSMSLFKIPRMVCNGINLVLAKYWWGQMRIEKKKFNGLARVNFAPQKIKEGWGFRISMHST